MARKKLGEMLIEAGVLDEARLRSALADQRRWGRSLGKTLVEMRLIGEDELVRVLGKQLGCAADPTSGPNQLPSLWNRLGSVRGDQPQHNQHASQQVLRFDNTCINQFGIG